MKKLFCKKCNKFMGKMEEGSTIRYGHAILCKECMDHYEKCDASIKAMDILKNNSNHSSPNYSSPEVMDFLNGIFNGGKK